MRSKDPPRVKVWSKNNSDLRDETATAAKFETSVEPFLVVIHSLGVSAMAFGEVGTAHEQQLVDKC